MRLRYLLFLLLHVLAPYPSTAQNQNNIWYFGYNAGIDFNTSPPTPLDDGQTMTRGGTAVVSDPKTGALLFYTDGISIWNRNHAVMPHGRSLHGAELATQSALIVPKPGDSDIYYVFTAMDPPRNLTIGVQYSIVDMRLDNGLGDIADTTTGRNVPLLAPGTEKLTSVPHCNGRDIWVITHRGADNRFYAYLMTDQGLDTTPVVSSVGFSALNNNYSIGQLQASPDGRRLAVAAFKLGAEIYDFDNITGIVSNPITLSSGTNAFGICFSPDNSKVYVTRQYERDLYQYDLSSGQAATIVASRTLIDHRNNDLRALQLGPDGRIYVSYYISSYIGVIDRPNLAGTACNFIIDGITFANRHLSKIGMPNLVVSQPNPYSVTFPSLADTSICAGEAVQLHAEGAAVYQWSPSRGLSCTTCPDPIASPSTTTDYTVLATNGGCVRTHTVTVTVLPVPSLVASADTTLCSGDSIRLSASGADSYRWSPGVGLSCDTCREPIAAPTVTTIYTLVGSNANGCIDTTTTTVTVVPDVSLKVGPDTVLCVGGSARLHASGGEQYRWEPQDGLSCVYCSDPIARPKRTTIYRVFAWNSGGCAADDSVTVTIQPPPEVDAGRAVRICLGDSTRLHASGGVAFSWSPSHGLDCTDCSDPVARPDATTTYTVTAVDQFGCVGSDTVTVAVGTSITATVGSDTAICLGEGVVLHASGGAGYAWHPVDGLSCADCPDPVASPSETTSYTVVVTGSENCAGIDSASVMVVVEPPPLIRVEGETDICPGSSTELRTSGGTDYRWYPIDGLSCADCPDPVASPSTTTTYTVTATNGTGCADSTTVRITVHEPPPVDAGADRTICSGDSIPLAASGAAAYSWSPAIGLSCADCPDPIASPTTTTTYTVTGVDPTGCSASDVVTVSVRPSVVVDAGRDTIICPTGTATITASDGESFRWSPSDGLDCPTCRSTHARPSETTDYTVTVTDANGCIGTDHVRVVVDTTSPIVRSSIDRHLRAVPGSPIVVPVSLDDRLDVASVDLLEFTLAYDPTIIRLSGITPTGTLVEGWSIEQEQNDQATGVYKARLRAPKNAVLLGNGPLLRLNLTGFIGSTDSSELRFGIDLPETECVVVRTTPGLLRVDSICGHNFRLIQTTATDFALEPNRPNPFNPTTELSFSIGLDGPARLEVFDAEGRSVAVLVDEKMAAGNYAVTWDASAYPSGIYYYRLTSGGWSRTNVMALVK